MSNAASKTSGFFSWTTRSRRRENSTASASEISFLGSCAGGAAWAKSEVAIARKSSVTTTLPFGWKLGAGSWKLLHFPDVAAVQQLVQVALAQLGLRLGDLVHRPLLESRQRLGAEHAQRRRELGMRDARQEVRERRILLVVDDEVLLGDAVLAQLHDLGPQAVQPDPLLLVLAEDEGLAVLEGDVLVVAELLVG